MALLNFGDDEKLERGDEVWYISPDINLAGRAAKNIDDRKIIFEVKKGTLVDQDMPNFEYSVLPEDDNSTRKVKKEWLALTEEDAEEKRKRHNRRSIEHTVRRLRTVESKVGDIEEWINSFEN